jgi:hypothetical protein
VVDVAAVEDGVQFVKVKVHVDDADKAVDPSKVVLVLAAPTV